MPPDALQGQLPQASWLRRGIPGELLPKCYQVKGNGEQVGSVRGADPSWLGGKEELDVHRKSAEYQQTPVEQTSVDTGSDGYT